MRTSNQSMSRHILHMSRWCSLHPHFLLKLPPGQIDHSQRHGFTDFDRCAGHPVSLTTTVASIPVPITVTTTARNSLPAFKRNTWSACCFVNSSDTLVPLQ